MSRKPTVNADAPSSRPRLHRAYKPASTSFIATTSVGYEREKKTISSRVAVAITIVVTTTITCQGTR